MDCAQGHVRTASTAQINCFGHQCEHELNFEEIALIVGKGDIISGRRDPLYEDIVERKTFAAIVSDPLSYATCPSPNCNWTVARFMRGESEEATCGQCGLVFCTNCNDIYHYRTTCRQLRQSKTLREDWIVSGRSAYWKHDQKNSKQAERTARKEKESIARVRDIRLKDEQYKAEKCRHCPNCDRIVERLPRTCGAMRCGHDTDTGLNRQHGCGVSFQWDKAKPYKPFTIGRDICYEVAKPEKEKFHHVGVKCDQCNEDGRGLRFECINCKSFNLCEQCEVNHSASHIVGHVFRLHKRQ